MSHLRPVTNTEQVEAYADEDLPEFEGQHVDFSRYRLTGVADLEPRDGGVAHLDDLVRLYVEGRVTRVDHVVDDKSGKLKRVQTVKIVDAMQLPWHDPAAFDG